MKKISLVLICALISYNCSTNNKSEELSNPNLIEKNKSDSISIITQQNINDSLSTLNTCDKFEGIDIERLRNKLGVSFNEIVSKKDNKIFESPLYYHGELYNGIVKLCHDNGIINGTIVFKDGFANGKSTYYFEGALAIIGSYKNGKEHGEFTHFDKNGIITEKSILEKGEVIQRAVFD